MNAAGEWKSITTAPKDGTEILIVMPGGQSDHFHVMYWCSEEERWCSRYTAYLRITEKELAACYLLPMWAEINDPPSSLCAGPGIVQERTE